MVTIAGGILLAFLIVVLLPALPFVLAGIVLPMSFLGLALMASLAGVKYVIALAVISGLLAWRLSPK